MARILFISRSIAQANYHGGCVYADAVLRYLAAEGHEVDYCWLTGESRVCPPVRRSPDIGSHIRGVHMFRRTRLGGWMISRDPGNWLRIPGSLLGSRQTQKFAQDSPTVPRADEQHWVNALVRQLDPEVVLIDFTENTPILDKLPRELRQRVQVLVLTHNIIHLRVQSYQAQGYALDFPPLTRDQEIDFLRRADVIVAIQQAEADELGKMLPEKPVVNSPMPAILRPANLDQQIEGRCLFVGGATGHNITGLRWFLEEIWPLILQRVPQATLDVCGGVCGSVDLRPHQVRFLGIVPDLSPCYGEASVALVPLRAGSGLKIKVVEAMSFQRPIVSTSIGVQGLPGLDQSEVFPVVNSAPEFAVEVVRLLTDGSARQRVMARQHEWIGNHLSPRAAFQTLVEALEKKR